MTEDQLDKWFRKALVSIKRKVLNNEIDSPQEMYGEWLGYSYDLKLEFYNKAETKDYKAKFDRYLIPTYNVLSKIGNGGIEYHTSVYLPIEKINMDELSNSDKNIYLDRWFSNLSFTLKCDVTFEHYNIEAIRIQFVFDKWESYNVEEKVKQYNRICSYY